jgi:HEAT repeat protein
MPLVRRDNTVPRQESPGDQDPAPLVARLDSEDADERWRAARALSDHTDAVPALAAALGRESAPQVSEAIITALMRIGGEAGIAALVPYLRSSDAARRSAVTEALQALPQAIAPFLTALLDDADPDVRIRAVELARGMPAREATALLSALILREGDANVCAAAIDVLSELGTRDALPALRACAEKFAGTPFLPFAISVAIARISDEEA